MSSDDKSSENFNENELKDIMSEIEDLEREVVSDPQVAPSNDSSPKNDLQASIDEELAQAQSSGQEPQDIEDEEDPAIEFDEGELEALECDEDFEEEVTSEVDSKEPDNVVAFTSTNKKSTPTHGTGNSAVQLQASGNMGLNLAFNVGEDKATLNIDEEEGLQVSFDSLNLRIHPTEGCTVEMDNGMKFTIPFGESKKEVKKAS